MTSKAYITNLSAYNDGVLLGTWAELPANEEEVLELLTYNGEPCEEYFITDYDCEIDLYNLFGEYVSIEKLNDAAERLEKLDDDQVEIVSALLSDGYDLDKALDIVGDCIMWRVADMTELAEIYCDECGILDSIPENLRYYFDFEAYGRDMRLEGHYIETEHGIVEVID